MRTVRFELRLAIRHLRAGGSQTLLIVGGVAMAVTLVIFISGLIGGVQRRIVRDITGSLPHITVEAQELEPRLPRDIDARFPGAQVFFDLGRRTYQREKIDQALTLEEELRLFPHVVAVSPGVTGQGIASFGNKDAGVRVQGAIPARYDRIVSIAEDQLAGDFLSIAVGQCAMGYRLAEELGLELGDRIRLTSGVGRQEVLRVTCLVSTGQENVDDGWVFVPLRTAQSLFALGTSVSAFSIRLDELFMADEVAAQMETSLGLNARSWVEQNPGIVNALRAQSSSSAIISIFSLVAAGFAISSVLIVSVLKRSKEIGILKAMGARSRQILIVFTLEGLGIAVAGSALGALVGSGLILGLRLITQPSLSPGQEPQPLLPGVLTPALIIGAVTAALVVTVVAAALPAKQAAALDPVQVMRGG